MSLPFFGVASVAASAAIVTAVNEWRMPVVATRFTPLTATGAFVTYLQLTTPIIPGGGVWMLNLNILTGGAATAQGTDLELQIVRDIGTGGELATPGPLAEFGVAAGRFANALTLYEPLVAGVHTYDVQLRQPTSPGSFDGLVALMAFQRWV